MDRPRFKRVEGSRDELHRRYHGGGLVEAVFYLVDAWYQGRLQLWRRSCSENLLKVPAPASSAAWSPRIAEEPAGRKNGELPRQSVRCPHSAVTAESIDA